MERRGSVRNRAVERMDARARAEARQGGGRRAVVHDDAVRRARLHVGKRRVVSVHVERAAVEHDERMGIQLPVGLQAHRAARLQADHGLERGDARVLRARDRAAAHVQKHIVRLRAGEAQRALAPLGDVALLRDRPRQLHDAVRAQHLDAAACRDDGIRNRHLLARHVREPAVRGLDRRSAERPAGGHADASTIDHDRRPGGESRRVPQNDRPRTRPRHGAVPAHGARERDLARARELERAALQHDGVRVGARAGGGVDERAVDERHRVEHDLAPGRHHDRPVARPLADHVEVLVRQRDRARERARVVMDNGRAGRDRDVLARGLAQDDVVRQDDAAGRLDDDALADERGRARVVASNHERPPGGKRDGERVRVRRIRRQHAPEHVGFRVRGNGERRVRAEMEMSPLRIHIT